MRKGYIVPNSTAESSGMLKLLQSKNWEPSQNGAMNQYNKICSSDHQLMETEMARILANVLSPISYKVLVENALGFMKENRKRYFEAAYITLDRMVEGGSARRVETRKGNEYALTTQGRNAYLRRQKMIEAGSRRKGSDEIAAEFGAFVDQMR